MCAGAFVNEAMTLTTSEGLCARQIQVQRIPLARGTLKEQLLAAEVLNDPNRAHELLVCPQLAVHDPTVTQEELLLIGLHMDVPRRFSKTGHPELVARSKPQLTNPLQVRCAQTPVAFKCSVVSSVVST